jgi:hypothetical protein
VDGGLAGDSVDGGLLRGALKPNSFMPQQLLLASFTDLKAHPNILLFSATTDETVLAMYVRHAQSGSVSDFEQLLHMLTLAQWSALELG